MRRDERGAALVEFAVVASVLLLILFGIIEFGLVFRDQLTVANSTQSSARVVSTLGSDTQSDYEALQSLARSLSTLPNSGLGVVQEVHIYNANGLGEPITTCGDPGVGGPNCNVYQYAPGVDLPGCDWDPCPDIANGGSYGGSWDPVLRDVVLDADGLEVVGVRVYYSHRWFSGFFPLPDVDCTSPPAGCWNDTALMRFEPLLFEDSL